MYATGARKSPLDIRTFTRKPTKGYSLPKGGERYQSEDIVEMKQDIKDIRNAVVK